MTLKSALEDLRQTTLPAISGLLGRLAYLVSLRRPHGGYEHWGMETVYGRDSAERALRAAHADVIANILRTPLPVLVDDLQESGKHSGTTAQAHLENLRDHPETLLPSDRADSPTCAHLNSVLAALLSLEKNRSHATRSAS